ncbi:Kazal-like serine protease inhibitor domain-containing protein [Phytophthora sojae]|uniref:Kazal-like serine protease inhibitor domain-containing protein n=1 Tax=Phytophthora sojae (strain P6497) TaxID=1094619 RepID=G5A927_PHYSP|nr:Kazal-like serine protease inhibitor domain-containing protein [Phytophthora sojae]EGZ08403.1 Kazal-like serine protease inhibitor domain-containing protein [Phytophthora sojae]|eukprot:XP_009536575.1 Kazal-like serine protease inhibitor domain-containing protein [Phytophthora sojae]
MKFAVAAVLASLLIAGISADETWACANVPYIKCDHDNTEVCASNGVTYKNSCEFSKANCDNKGMRVLHQGMCNRSEGGRRLRDVEA